MDHSLSKRPALHLSAYFASAMACASFATNTWAVIASDDSRTSLVDTTRIINVLVNDQSPNLDSPTTKVCIAGQTDACPGLQTPLQAPSNGSISLSPDGRSIVYSPSPGFIGTDQFTYAVYVPDDADLGLPTLDTARVRVQMLSPSNREDLGRNVQNFETLFGIFCDPSINSQIADDSVRNQVQTQCAAYQNLTLEQQAQALISLTPEQVSATFTAALTSTKDQQKNVAVRLNELRSGASGMSLANFHFYHHGQHLQGAWLAEFADMVGGGASADQQFSASPFSRLGFFLNGSITRGDRNASALERSYDLDASNITLGMDYRYSDTLIGGIAIGYSSSELDFARQQDSIETDSTNLLVYGTWHHDLFYIDAITGIALGDVKSRRGIAIGDAFETQAKGSTNSKQASMSLSINHDYQYQALTLSPYAAFDYTQGVIDGYRERNGAGFGVVFSDQEIKSQLMSVGIRSQFAWGQPWGVLIPHGRLEYKKEFETSRDLITGRFISDPTGNRFFIESDRVDGNWGQLALGVAAIFPHGISGYVEYERILNLRHMSLHTFSVGGRWEANF